MQDDVHLLVQALNTFALEIDAADSRKDILANAGIHLAFLCKLIFGTSAYLFANKLAAQFRDYRMSDQQPMYHPMVSLLEYLLKVHELEDQDRNLFIRLVKQGLENFAGQVARNTVGRIESPLGNAMGTGVLVNSQALLTCRHVFERILEGGQDHAWVRFGYKTGKYGVELGEVFKLDEESFANNDSQSDNALDYTLVRIIGKPGKQMATLSNEVLNTTQNIRLVHHPRGEPVRISDVGQVVHVDKEYINHNIKADYGSSGAPIFDLNWHVVAIHRGNLALSRSYALGVTEAIPISSIWNDIKPHLSISVT